MAGTIKGGKLAAKTNKAYHGEDFYKRIGALGGKASNTGGFYANRDLAKEAGRRGGRVSTRSKNPDSLKARRARADFQEGFNKPGYLARLRNKYAN